MITISMDEQGKFENILDSSAMFVAGLIYDDNGDPADTSREQARIRKYYEKVCADVNASYPVDLHCGRRNDDKVAMVKNKVSETLGEFLKDGTYNGEFPEEDGQSAGSLRAGKYYLFATVKSRSGIDSLLNEGVSKLAKDDVAGNLYVHMAEDVLVRLIFHNPKIRNICHVNLDLPTRQAVFNDDDREKSFMDLGYKKDTQHSIQNRSHYFLTNADVFRTAIEREMIRSGRIDIQIDRFQTRSINYYVEESRRESFSFLYMADSVCSYIGFQMTGNQPSEWIYEIQKRFERLLPAEQILVFAYDSVDVYYDRAVRALEKKKYYNALEAIYTGINLQDNEMLPFYRDRWFKGILRDIHNETDTEAFDEAVYLLDKYMHRNNLEPNRALYLYEQLSGMNAVHSNGIRRETLYNLYDCGISAYTHVGKSEKAMECYEKTCCYSSYAGIEKNAATRMKTAVYFNDSLQYEKALEVADENIQYLTELAELREIMIDQDNVFSVSLAKGYSQMAQSYALLHNSKADELFDNALKLFGAGTPDYYITLSYKLHYYIELENAAGKKLYNQYVKAFLGGKESLEDQFVYILQEGKKGKTGLIDMRHALYVFLKGLYYYNFDQADEKFLNRLFNLENEVRNCCPTVSFTSHPWELVFKYLSLIALADEREKLADKYREKMEKSIHGADKILAGIIAVGSAEFYKLTGNRKMFCKAVEKAVIASDLDIDLKNTDEAYRELLKRITYFYR